MNVRVKFIESFKDGTIFGSKAFAAGEVTVLTEQELARVRSSGGIVEEIEKVIRNPLKAEREAQKELNDTLNPENGINELETHIPGLEDEVEAVREKDAKKKRK